MIAMIFLPGDHGRSFRCHCGANCFLRQGNLFTCNACGERYEGIR